MNRFLFLLILLTCSASVWAGPRAAVVVVVDQLRADMPARFAAKKEGGFFRLLQKGARFSHATAAHVPTDTAPGHAALSTGFLPRDHGVVGNRWYDRKERKEKYVVDGSAENLLVPTIGDRLKEQNPKAQVGSFSLKDRSAILMGGKKADWALWFDKKTGQFTSSSSYPDLPPWYADFSSSHNPFARGSRVSPKNAESFLASPSSDWALLDLVNAFLLNEVSSESPSPVLLWISFSGLDYVGHGSGPFGPEAERQLEALDQILDELLNTLEGKFGKDGFLFCLTADHGVLPIPESPEGQKMGATRETEKSFLEDLEKTVANLFPRVSTGWVEAFNPPHVYFNRDLVKELRLEWGAFLARVSSEIGFMPEVAAVYLPGDWTRGLSDPYLEVYQNGFHAERGGDIMIRLKEGLLVKKYYVKTGHGSPYAYDARVPLLFFGPHVASGEVTGSAFLQDVAPTLATWFGLPVPPGGGKTLIPLIQKTNDQ